jgi:hypothetical protein
LIDLNPRIPLRLNQGSISPDERLLHSQVDQGGSDLMLAENFREEFRYSGLPSRASFTVSKTLLISNAHGINPEQTVRLHIEGPVMDTTGGAQNHGFKLMASPSIPFAWMAFDPEGSALPTRRLSNDHQIRLRSVGQP